MPENATITAFNSFSPQTRIRSSEVNTNFSNFRGHLIPIDPNTATASNNNYDLGSTEYKWRNIYASNIVVTSGTAYQPTWTTHTLTFSDFNQATSTAQATVANLVNRGLVHAYNAKHTTAFAGGSITDVKLNFGTSTTVDYFIGNFDVDQAVTDTAYYIGQGLDLLSFTNTTSLLATLSCTGANADSLTAGVVEISLLRSLLP